MFRHCKIDIVSQPRKKGEKCLIHFSTVGNDL